MDPIADLVETEPDAPPAVVATAARMYHEQQQLQNWLALALDVHPNGSVGVAPMPADGADMWDGLEGEYIRSTDGYYYSLTVESSVDTGGLYDDDREQFEALMDSIGAELESREGRARLSPGDALLAIETLARYATLRAVANRSQEIGVAPAVDQLATEIVPQAVWARQRDVGRQAINKHVHLE